MLIKIEGVWINPRHVIRVNGEQEPAVVVMSDGVAIQSMKPADELAAIFNGDPAQAEALAQKAEILNRRLATYVYRNETERSNAMTAASYDYEIRKNKGENVQWRHLRALNGNAYVVERLD